MIKKVLSLFCIAVFTASQAQTVTVTVDPTQLLKPISPYIYGRNNSGSDDPSNPVSNADWQLYNDAGLRMYRENGGNNCTKYNWRLKLSSHPDWYNNVYTHDWDYDATQILTKTNNTQILLGLQLLGKAASNKNNNFDDWSYNQSQWTTAASNNWAGGGDPSSGNGNPNLYLENWTADSTTGIFKHLFQSLHLDSIRLQYWNMDNEPEGWADTHDDVVTTPSLVTAEGYMQKYFAVAKKARAKYPHVKLVGPVSMNEWQWFAWNNSKVHNAADGKDYVWIEYFIKRIGEEQAVSGIRLLDLLDFHFYPGSANSPSNTLQLHRIWYDTTYNCPYANGVKLTDPSGWGNNITKEYLFKRCQAWLNQYLGNNNGVTFSISECGDIANSGSENANVVACWYASQLGTFANNGVEIFTPWDWYHGQWEVMHLFTKHSGTTSIKTTSSLDTLLSGYSSVKALADTVFVTIVNRDQSNARNVSINMQNFGSSSTLVNGYQLSNLGSAETFVSATNNALASKQYTVTTGHINFSAPKLSVTLIKIPRAVTTGIAGLKTAPAVSVYPNPARERIFIKCDGPFNATLYDLSGRKLLASSAESFDVSSFSAGTYIVEISSDSLVKRQLVQVIK